MTNFADDIADDMSCFDSTQTVIVTTAEGISVTVPEAAVGPVSQQELSMMDNVLGMEPTVCKFHLRAALTGSVVVAAGDLLTDSGTKRWRVLSVRYSTLGTRIELSCALEP